MNAVLYAFPVFLVLICLELWWSHVSGKKVFRAADSLTSMNIGAISEISRGLVKTVTFGLYGLLELQAGLVDFTARDPLAWGLGVFLYDFFYYWAHRAGHEVKINYLYISILYISYSYWIVWEVFCLLYNKLRASKHQNGI